MTQDHLPATAKNLQDLLDREAIRDCLHRYCRGVDRRDEACLKSVYWPEATDQHGPYQGSAEGFVNWALEKLQSAPRGVHMLSNILIDLRGNKAGVESYFHALQTEVGADDQVLECMMAGRYIDLFEKRDDEWRVAKRTVVYDWIRYSDKGELSDEQRFGVRQPNGRQQPDDTLYQMLESL